MSSNNFLYSVPNAPDLYQLYLAFIFIHSIINNVYKLTMELYDTRRKYEEVYLGIL